MTQYQPYRKGTVLALSGSVDHLHVICNDPAYSHIESCDCVLAVNISSVKAGVPYDPTCIIKIGDHPFIRHNSYVVYERAVIWKVENIDKKVAEGSIKPQDANIDDDAFKRILDGFDISDEVEPKIRRFWKNHC